MRSLPLITVLTLTGSAFTQTHQEFRLYGSQTSFTSRGGLGTQKGEALQGFHASHHIGLAENNGGGANRSCKITQLSIMHQDQNCGSQETFDFVVRGGTDSKGPTAGTAAIIGEVKGLKTPTRGNSTCAFLTLTTLSSNAQIALNCPTVQGTNIKRDFFSVGVRLRAAPTWTMDGQSVHVAFGTSANPDQNSWTETVTTGAPDHAWELVGTTTIAKHPAGNRTWNVSWFTQGVTMQLGCGHAYGMGGMFPRSSTSTSPIAYTALLRGGSGMSGASSVVVISPSLFPNILPFGSGASMYINPAGMVLFPGGKADGRGEVVVYLANFLPLLKPPAGFKVPFQGALDHASTGLRLSNVQFCEPK